MAGLARGRYRFCWNLVSADGCMAALVRCREWVCEESIEFLASHDSELGRLRRRFPRAFDNIDNWRGNLGLLRTVVGAFETADNAYWSRSSMRLTRSSTRSHLTRVERSGFPCVSDRWATTSSEAPCCQCFSSMRSKVSASGRSLRSTSSGNGPPNWTLNGFHRSTWASDSFDVRAPLNMSRGSSVPCRMATRERQRHWRIAGASAFQIARSTRTCHGR